MRMPAQRAAAMTLIEVVVGMAILGMILASLVVARSRYLHQWSLAGRKQQAVAAADALLADWWKDPSQLPRNSSGVFRSDGMLWRTHVMNNRQANALDVQAVRLEVFEQKSGAAQVPMPLATVDIILNPVTEATAERSK